MTSFSHFAVCIVARRGHLQCAQKSRSYKWRIQNNGNKGSFSQNIFIFDKIHRSIFKRGGEGEGYYKTAFVSERNFKGRRLLERRRLLEKGRYIESFIGVVVVSALEFRSVGRWWLRFCIILIIDIETTYDYYYYCAL